MMQEQLWLSDSGKIVCERVSCTGEALQAKIVNGRGLELSHVVGDERFSRMSRSDLAELGPLIAGTDGELICDGGHVRYNMRARELQVVQTA